VIGCKINNSIQNNNGSRITIMKRVSKWLKYALVSITYCITYGIINYFVNSEFRLNELIISFVVLFLILDILYYIAPYLRIFLGFKGKE